MFLSFLKSFLAKRRQKAAERNLFCQTYIGRFKKAAETFLPQGRDKDTLSKWLKENDNLHEECSFLNFASYLRSDFYVELMRQKSEFDTLWKQISEKHLALEQNDFCSAFKTKIDAATMALNSIFSIKRDYIRHELVDGWKKDNETLIYEVSRISDAQISHSDFFKKFKSQKSNFLNQAHSLEQRIKEHNDAAMLMRINDVKMNFGLDNQQAECVVKEAHSQLILAGAGTGKTTTIVGKVKYLLKENICNPDEILLLAYNKSIAKEMSLRVKKETGSDVECATFHSYGLGLVKEVDGTGVSVFGGDNPNKVLRKFIEDILKECAKDDEYLKKLLDYLTGAELDVKDFFECKTEADYNNFSESLPCSLKGEYLKSKGELDIANFLFLNGVDYKYEDEYCVNTRTAEFPKQYCPDFHLQGDFDKVYIEYFGIDKNGNVPKWFTSRHGKSPSVEYNESIRWKCYIHEKTGTTMVKCYAYEKFEGDMLENLGEKLNALGIVLHPKSNDEIRTLVFDAKSESTSLFGEVVSLFVSMVNLVKSNGCTMDKLYFQNLNSKNFTENKLILDLFSPVYKAYEENLKTHGQIDFNDMINKAADYAASGKIPSINKYKYVIVDEYQDISKARNNLLYSMRRRNNFKLFCVGDDWQSIYRFAGSDIGLILNFKKTWEEFGATDNNKIETTYRYTQTLADVAGDFVMENGAQIRKLIKCGRNQSDDFSLGMVPSIYELRWRLEKEYIPDGSKVLFLGRNKNDVDVFRNVITDGSFTILEKGARIVYRNRPDLDIVFKTVHSSKGLEADYVFILNNKNTMDGFPNRMKDPPIYELLLDSVEQYPYAEERRLFYVALTRAKKKAYLVRYKDKESSFYEEIKQKHTHYLKEEISQFLCPYCNGKLHLVDNNTKWGCRNFSNPEINCHYIRERK